MKKENSFFQKKHIVLLPLALLFTSFLLIYAVKGSYSRYLADDYCYGYRINDNGLLNHQIVSYLTPTEYSSNRFSSTLVHSIVEKTGGPYVVPYLPAAAIIIWLAASIYLIGQVKPYFAEKENFLATLTVAAFLLVFAFYLAPNLYQVLFWLAGMQSYLTPTVLFTILFGRILHFSKQENLARRHLLEIIVIGFFANGFSETSTAWQITLLSLVLMLALIFRHKNTVYPYLIKPLSIGLISVISGFAVMLACPTNALRQSNFETPGLQTLVEKTLLHTIEFSRFSISGKIIPFSILLAFGFFIGTYIKPTTKRENKFYVTLFFIVNIASFILIASIMAPTMYAMSVYPGVRALFPGHLTLIIAIFLDGWIISELIFKNLPALLKHKNILLVFVGSALFIYAGLRITPYIYEKIDAYKARAEAWDDRHETLINYQKAGELNVLVPAFDSVHEILAIKDKPNHWINYCAKEYYELESITAQQNINGVSTYPIGK